MSTCLHNLFRKLSDRMPKKQIDPRTAFEKEMHIRFDSLKSAGHALFLLVRDYDIDAGHYRYVPQGQVIQYQTTQPFSILKCMDLNRSFEEQWPYEPGTIDGPLALLAPKAANENFSPPNPAPNKQDTDQQPIHMP